MRDFNDADRKKKKDRIKLPENPAGLSPDELSKLESNVKSSLKDGYIPCPVAWKIAKDAGVPKIAVGAITDRLGIRVTDCQLGCFKVDKTPYDSSVRKDVDREIAAALEALSKNNGLTCAAAFDFARQMKLKPSQISEAINNLGLKIHQCQLGCF